MSRADCEQPLRAPLGDFVQTLRGLLAARRPRGGNLRPKAACAGVSTLAGHAAAPLRAPRDGKQTFNFLPRTQPTVTGRPRTLLLNRGLNVGFQTSIAPYFFSTFRFRLRICVKERGV